MKEDDPHWQQICAFVRKYTSDDAHLEPSTELVFDLGIDGDEAFYFMEAFASEFSLSPGDFDFNRYFAPEGFNPISLIIDIIRNVPRKQPLTLAMLFKAASAGIWTTQDIELI